MVFGSEDLVLLGLCFLPHGLRLSAVLATMLLDELGLIGGKLPPSLSFCISVSFGGLYVAGVVAIGTLIKLVYKAGASARWSCYSSSSRGEVWMSALNSFGLKGSSTKMGSPDAILLDKACLVM